MASQLFIFKVQNKLWSKLVQYTQNTKLYPYIYRSYWHYLLDKTNLKRNSICYYAARPNPGAGIGHQLANWIAGYWYARQFGLKFAHLPFSTQKWEDFLGFGEGEAKVDELIKSGYKARKLPLFNEDNKSEVDLIKAIIASYAGKDVIFIAEQDQFYKAQYGVIEEIQRKFYAAPSRNEDKLVYSKESYNIAIHIRRGDIIIGQENKNRNLLIRWQNNDYFANVLSNVLKTIMMGKPITIYLFSQGSENDFKYFKHFPNLHFCLEMSDRDSFLHMVYADLLITSKSSFSYKPALLNKGIKVCPKNFWHGYPDAEDWILADEDGNFELNKK